MTGGELEFIISVLYQCIQIIPLIFFLFLCLTIKTVYAGDESMRCIPYEWHGIISDIIKMIGQTSGHRLHDQNNVACIYLLDFGIIHFEHNAHACIQSLGSIGGSHHQRHHPHTPCPIPVQLVLYQHTLIGWSSIPCSNRIFSPRYTNDRCKLSRLFITI